MKTLTKFIAGTTAAIALAAGLAGCSTAATTVSDNLSTAADSFEVNRRIVFFNGITDTYLLEIEGLCSIADEGNQLEVTCKIADGDDNSSFKKHFLGLSDNVTYFVEQIESSKVDPFHHRVVFRPETIIPDIDLQTSNEETD